MCQACRDRGPSAGKDRLTEEGPEQRQGGQGERYPIQPGVRAPSRQAEGAGLGQQIQADLGGAVRGTGMLAHPGLRPHITGAIGPSTPHQSPDPGLLGVTGFSLHFSPSGALHLITVSGKCYRKAVRVGSLRFGRSCPPRLLPASPLPPEKARNGMKSTAGGNYLHLLVTFLRKVMHSLPCTFQTVSSVLAQASPRAALRASTPPPGLRSARQPPHWPPA